MRRVVFAAIALVLAGLGVLHAGPRPAGAQEGVSVQMLGRGEPPEAAGQQLTLLRATFAVGSELRPHRHPGPMLLYIESGALTYTLMEGTAEITRASAPSTGATPEILAAGQGTVLDVGDQLLERGVVHAAHNAGADPAVVLISALLAPGQPVTRFVEPRP
jgi:quercetin dioxygenase-like cupin family protein